MYVPCLVIMKRVKKTIINNNNKNRRMCVRNTEINERWWRVAKWSFQYYAHTFSWVLSWGMCVERCGTISLLFIIILLLFIARYFKMGFFQASALNHFKSKLVKHWLSSFFSFFALLCAFLYSFIFLSLFEAEKNLYIVAYIRWNHLHEYFMYFYEIFEFDWGGILSEREIFSTKI